MPATLSHEAPVANALISVASVSSSTCSRVGWAPGSAEGSEWKWLMAWLMLTGRARPSTVSTTETRMKRMTMNSYDKSVTIIAIAIAAVIIAAMAVNWQVTHERALAYAECVRAHAPVECKIRP